MTSGSRATPCIARRRRTSRPSAATRIAYVTSGTTYADAGLAAGTYRYRVIAEDDAGNASAPSSEVAATALPDATAPTVALTAPAAGATSAAA